MTIASEPTVKEKRSPLRPLSLRANFSWTFFGNILYAGCQWGMLVALAKLGTPEMVGQFTLGLAVTAPIILLASSQLRLVQATDSRHDYQFGEYLGLRLVALVLAYIAIIGMSVLTGYAGETLLVVLIIGMAKVFEAISDIIYGLFQQYERMDRISRSLVSRGVLSLAALSLGVLVSQSIIVGVLALAGVWLLNLILYDIRHARILLQSTPEGDAYLPPASTSIRPIFNARRLLRLTWMVLPLGIVAMLNSLIPNTPRYIIEGSMGVRELGFFASMAFLMELGNTVVMAMGQASAPPIARYYNDGNIEKMLLLVMKMCGILVVMSVIGIVAAQIAGKEILTLIYTEEYAAHADVFVTLIIAASVINIGSFLGYVMTATRYFRSQVIISGATLAGITAASLYLIPIYGLQGAAYAVAVSGFVRLLGCIASLGHVWFSTRRKVKLVEA